MRELERHPSHRSVECAAVALAGVGLGILFVRVWLALDAPFDVLAFALAAALAYLAADFISGLVHWAFDRLIDERVPYLGPNFVRPFREHHADPLEITQHDFVELNGNTCIAALPLLAAVLFAFEPDAAGAGAVAVTTFVGMLLLWTIATNQFHKWSHQMAPPIIARWLQRAHVVLEPQHHSVHHREPFDTRFCITSGWMNRWADRVGLWRRLEALAQRSTRATSRPGLAD